MAPVARQKTGWRTRVRRLTACALLGAIASYCDISTFRDSPSELAASYAKKAKKAKKAGHAAEAYLLYSEAAALQPKKRAYRGEMEALQSRAVRETKSTAPAPAVEDASSPATVFDSMTAKEMAEARPLQDAERLKPSPGAQAFDLRADPRTLWDTVARRFGLEAVYDSDYPKDNAPERFHVDNADYRQALHDLEAATSSFVVPLSSRIFMVAKDTPQKRQGLEQTLTVAIPVPSALTTQELTELAQTIRQITDIQKIAWNTVDDKIIMRGRVSRVLAAEALIEQLAANRAEALLDIEYVEVTRSDILQYGFNPTSQFSMIFLGHILNNVISVPSGVTNLITFGGGKTLMGITAAEVQALFNANLSDSKILYRSQLRAQSGQAATLHAGERYPVVTAGYFGAVPAGQQGQVYAPPPTFTYEDLGIQMKITPHVHGMDEMTVGVELSYEVLSGQANNGIPILGSRKVKTDARVRDGEWTVIAGMTSSSSSKSLSGFWGLSDVPLLGEAFKQTTSDKESAYVLIGIRPHLLSLPPDQTVTRAIAFGTETRSITPL